jgi:hypothetical protein
MQLKELLEHSMADVLQDRAAIVSGPAKRMWSDTAAVRYFNQAEQMFARKTYCIVDSSSAFCTITLVDGTSEYALDSSILQVLNVRMSDNGVDMTRATHEKISMAVNTGALVTPGYPWVWTTDEGVRKLRVYPVPDATAALNTLELRVIRMPSVALTLSALTAEPQIPVEHHLSLCDWVAYRALTTQDVDGSNRKEAMNFRAEFMSSIKDARADYKRLYQPPGMVTFGGWGNG